MPVSLPPVPTAGLEERDSDRLSAGYVAPVPVPHARTGTSGTVGAGLSALPCPGAIAVGYGFGSRYPAWYREDFRTLIELLRADKIHPVVAERLPLSDARRAHELLERSAAVGKLVLVP
jgi:NADPH:quinone reductase-like Zn-dependent oxidoreductase